MLNDNFHRNYFLQFLFSKPLNCLLQDIDVKRQGAISAYAFVQYADITSVVKALRTMDGEHLGANKIKVWSFCSFTRELATFLHPHLNPPHTRNTLKTHGF